MGTPPAHFAASRWIPAAAGCSGFTRRGCRVKPGSATPGPVGDDGGAIGSVGGGWVSGVGVGSGGSSRGSTTTAALPDGGANRRVPRRVICRLMRIARRRRRRPVRRAPRNPVAVGALGPGETGERPAGLSASRSCPRSSPSPARPSLPLSPRGPMTLLLRPPPRLWSAPTAPTALPRPRGASQAAGAAVSVVSASPAPRSPVTLPVALRLLTRSRLL